jgi:DNA polymerase III subunit gamma/tau
MEVGAAGKKPEATAPSLADGAVPASDAPHTNAGVPKSPTDIGPHNWAGLLPQLELNGMARSVAENSVPEGATADALNLLLQEDREMLYNPQCDQRIGSALTAFFGRPVSVTLRVGKPAHETPAARAARQARERQVAAEYAIEQDANVNLLLREFGGRLHRGSIRAREDRESSAAPEGGRNERLH